MVVAGNRVYFTGDGTKLYGEDGQEVTDADAVGDARRKQAQQPNATTYEEYQAKRQAELLAASNAEQLHTVMGRLDDLDDRIKRGNLSPEELAEAQKEKQDIVDAMPRDAREEYDRLQAARKSERSVSYSAVDPAFTSAPAVCKQFCEAGAPVAQRSNEESRTQTSSRTPVFTSAPDYSSPQGQ